GLITDWTETQIIAGDVDGDENITSYDAALILQYSAGLIDEFPTK
ncbi:GDSL family lipase, partial [candidate division KSB1 bacterium]|nr:GDSL family lipase [candidate division KSB1 bacterium]